MTVGLPLLSPLNMERHQLKYPMMHCDVQAIVFEAPLWSKTNWLLIDIYSVSTSSPQQRYVNNYIRGRQHTCVLNV